MFLYMYCNIQAFVLYGEPWLSDIVLFSIYLSIWVIYKFTLTIYDLNTPFLFNRNLLYQSTVTINETMPSVYETKVAIYKLFLSIYDTNSSIYYTKVAMYGTRCPIWNRNINILIHFYNICSILAMCWTKVSIYKLIITIHIIWYQIFNIWIQVSHVCNEPDALLWNQNIKIIIQFYNIWNHFIDVLIQNINL
jgi:hypothetical protein